MIVFEFDTHGEFRAESLKKLDNTVDEAKRQKAKLRYVIVPVVGADGTLVKRLRDELVRRGVTSAETRITEPKALDPGVSTDSVLLQFEPLEQ